ncbi:MAG: hypothetical protein ACK42I_06265, partial [Thermomicrobium sp.]
APPGRTLDIDIPRATPSLLQLIIRQSPSAMLGSLGVSAPSRRSPLSVRHGERRILMPSPSSPRMAPPQ